MKRYIPLLLFLLQSLVGLAQIDTVFWFAQPDVSRYLTTFPVNYCITTYDQPATVTIDQPANPSFTPITFSVPANGFFQYNAASLYTQMSTGSYNQVLNRGIRIQASAPVSCYFEVTGDNTEIYTLKGGNALGTDFLVPMQTRYRNNPIFNLTSSIEIVASQNGTVVEIHPTKALKGGISAGNTVNITLNQGQSYCIRAASALASGHLGGTRIYATKPIAVNSTDDVIMATANADLVGEQIVPVNKLGRRYVALNNIYNYSNPIGWEMNSSYAFIFPLENNTNVTINGVPHGTPLSINNSLEVQLTSAATLIEADRPIAVFQTTNLSLEMGATMLPHLECTGSHRVVHKVPSDINRNPFIAIVVATADVNNFTLGGICMPSNYFSTLPADPTLSYCIRQIPIPQDSIISIENSSGRFQMSVMDYTYHDGGSCTYGYFSDYAQASYVQFQMDTMQCSDDEVTFQYSAPNIDNLVLTGPNGLELTTEPFVLQLNDPHTPGMYYLTGIDTANCLQTLSDSIFLNFELCSPNIIVNLSDTVCEDDFPIRWNGATIILPPNFNFNHPVITATCTVHLAGGRDSITNLTLTVGRNYHNTVTDEVCDNQTFTFEGQLFDALDTVTGGVLYYDAHYLTHNYQCDSTNSLLLTVHPTYTVDTTATACGHFSWHGTTYTSSTNAPNHTATTAEGCDSTVNLHLTINPTYSFDSSAVVCDSFLWSPFRFTHTIDTTIHYATTALCDSAYNLHLTIGHSSAGDTTASACDSFTWYGSTYTSSTNTPTRISTNAAGCDSTTTLHLTIRHSSDTTVSEEVVENNLPHLFGGVSFTNDTFDAEIHLTNAAGCDSVIHYSLTVHWNNRTNVDSTVCDDHLPLIWNGVTFTAAGIQSVTLTNAIGADSIVSMTLHVNPTYNDTVPHSICANESLIFEGSSYLGTDAGYHPHLLTSSKGCDSLRVLDLEVRTLTAGDTTASECDSFNWYSTTYTSSTNTPTRISTNAAGCDSTTTLHLTIRHSSDTTISEEVVENNLPHLFGGVSFTSDTLNAEIHLTNAAGCDSVIHYSLTVHWNNRTNVDSTVCDDRLPLVWNGVAFTAAGIQSVTLTNVIGADSIVSMTLHVNPTYNDTVPHSICANESLTFEGSRYSGSDAGYHPHLLTSSKGCDSLRVLDLEVRALTAGDTTASECDSFNWYGTTYTSSTNTPTRISTNVAGCDSTTTLHLTIRHSSDTTISEEVVENDLPHLFGGVSFTNDTLDAEIHLTNAAGCDSVIHYSLTVHWNNRTNVDSTVCDDRLPLVWNGVSFTAAGIQSVTLTNAIGADSIVSMTLHVNPTYNDTVPHSICANESLSFEGSSYSGTDAGYHPHLLTSSKGCDSLRVLDLEVRALTAGDTTASECDSFNWYGTTYTSSTNTPTRISTNVAGCDSTTTLHLTIRHSSDTTVSEEVVENNLPHLFGGISFTSDTLNAEIHLTNADGCDSLIHYFLTVHWNQHTTLDTSVCADQFPIVWHGITFAISDETTMQDSLLLTATTGADSTVVLTVHRNPVYDLHFYDTIYRGDSCLWNGEWRLEGGEYSRTAITAAGCDSLQTLHLTVNPCTHLDTTLCRNHLPLLWEGATFTPSQLADIGPAQTLRDSVHLTTGGTDSLLVLSVTVLDTSSVTDSVEHCGFYTWRDGVEYRQSTYSPTLMLQNQLGCDSVIHLHLDIFFSQRYFDTLTVCDSLRWRRGMLLLRDTVDARDTVITATRCDSVFSLTLTVLHSSQREIVDSICYHTPYFWHSNIIPADTVGLFQFRFDTMNNVQCDSVTLLTITKLSQPEVSILADHDCYRHGYLLTAQATALPIEGGEPQLLPYRLWTSVPHDPLLDGNEHSDPIFVRPESPTEYTLYVDYRETPLCPVTNTISLNPVVTPKPQLRVSPEALSLGNMTFTARDITHAPDRERAWYIDGILQTENGPSIQRVATSDQDSIVIILEHSDSICRDTAIHVLKVYQVSLFAPNAFTPTQETNSRFLFVARGLLSAELFIYNREGLLVYHTTDYTQGWDGRTASGTPCPQGNYVWKLVYRAVDFPNSDRTQVGSVLLLR